MKEGLNLLPSVAKFQAAKVKLKKKISLVTGIFLGCWVLSMVIIFVWLGLNNILLNKAKKENTSTLNQYKSLVSSVVLSKKNKYQAKLVGKVLNERFEYGASINKITKIFSGNIVLENFEIKNKRQFILKCFLFDGSSMIEVEEKVRDINLGMFSDFKSAKLNSIGVDKDGWKFEMEVDLI